eukprot:scaffold81523_cov64-Attheya_sp.AAC.6
MTRSTARKSLALTMAIISAALMDLVEAYPIIGEVQEGEDKGFAIDEASMRHHGPGSMSQSPKKNPVLYVQVIYMP